MGVEAQPGAAQPENQAQAGQPSEPPNPAPSVRPTPELENPAEGRIQLDVVVTDAAGKPVTGLAAKDFALLDHNQSEKIVSFEAFSEISAKAEPPPQVILVIDAVNNDFEELGLIRQGVEQFLRQNGGHLAYPVSLALFTTRGVQMRSRPSTDGNALVQGLNRISASVRPKGIDAFPLSILALSRIATGEAKIPGRKLLVWLGPGWPTPIPNPEVMTSDDERDQRLEFFDLVLLSTELREAHIALYGGYANSAFYLRDFLKGVRTAREEDPRNLRLGVLSLQSGGRGALAWVNRDSDLMDQLNSFVAEAGDFYRLSFNPPRTEQADEYHDLKVVLDKPGLTARSSTGYYDQPSDARPKPKPSRRVGTEPIMVRVAQFRGEPVTVAKLEHVLRGLHTKADDETARELSGLVLTERLDSPLLAKWKAGLPGAKSRATLVALADASVFLNLPSAQIPATAAPDLTEQRRIISLAVDYLGKILPRLPNFLATRTTIRYEDTPPKPEHGGLAIGDGPWRVAGTSVATVLYRDGKEVVDPQAAKRKKAGEDEVGLITRGTFGPILTTVIVDAAHSKMTWSHWEDGQAGPEAVFRFEVPPEKSHYAVAFRGTASRDKGAASQQGSGYHGEIAIDAATGTVLRLTGEADLQPDMPIQRGDIMVEYGPAEIGGKTYTCPVRSVSMARGRMLVVVHGNEDSSIPGGDSTLLNDVTFENYHVFRSESRIITGLTPAPKEQ